MEAQLIMLGYHTALQVWGRHHPSNRSARDIIARWCDSYELLDILTKWVMNLHKAIAVRGLTTRH